LRYLSVNNSGNANLTSRTCRQNFANSRLKTELRLLAKEILF